MQGIYTYIPEANCVPREYSAAAILLLIFMVLISLVSVLNLLYFYISTFRSICAVPNMTVFCSFIIIIIIITVIIIIIIIIIQFLIYVQIQQLIFQSRTQGWSTDISWVNYIHTYIHTSANMDYIKKN